MQIVHGRLQSLAVPGLGLSRLTGDPHWIRGVAGYGCIAGAVILNRTAVNTFNEIENLEDFHEINETYDQAKQQDNISEVLAYTAIGIWVADLVWTLVGTSDLNRPSGLSENKGISVGGDIDPVSNVPMLSLRYRF